MRLCAIAALLAISSWAATAEAQVQATLTTNKGNFAPGDLLNVSLGLANGGSPAVLDVYFGVLLPDGVTILYFSDLGFTTAQASLHHLPTLKPIASGVNFPPGAVFNVPAFFQYRFNGQEPRGRYLFFLAATPPGGFTLDRVVVLQTREISLPATGGTVVSIAGDRFLLNNTVTHPGTAAEGLLLNSRMVQAVFDDENAATVWRSAYPDTGVWDAERNVREFIASLPSYAARGLRAVTVNLQGGSPGWSSGDRQPGIITGFNPDGTLKGAWLTRLDRVIRAADQHGLVVIVGLFYFGQDHRLSNEAAVVRGVDGMTDWLVGQGYRNVLLEINNEADLWYDHAILQPARVAELLARVRQRSGGTLKVSASLAGGVVPSSALISAADYILLHGNGQGPSGIARMVDDVRASATYQAHPKPIVFNEDSTAVANLEAAVSGRASWGYYDQGQNNYHDGFQSPPVNWTLNTRAKQAFFDRVSAFTASAAALVSGVPVTSLTLINADTNGPLSGFDTLTGWDVTVNPTPLPTRNVNLRANTFPSTVGCVDFELNRQEMYSLETLRRMRWGRYERGTTPSNACAMWPSPASRMIGRPAPPQSRTSSSTFPSTGRSICRCSAGSPHLCGGEAGDHHEHELSRRAHYSVHRRTVAPKALIAKNVCLVRHEHVEAGARELDNLRSRQAGAQIVLPLRGHHFLHFISLPQRRPLLVILDGPFA